MSDAPAILPVDLDRIERALRDVGTHPRPSASNPTQLQVRLGSDLFFVSLSEGDDPWLTVSAARLSQPVECAAGDTHGVCPDRCSGSFLRLYPPTRLNSTRPVRCAASNQCQCRAQGRQTGSGLH